MAISIVKQWQKTIIGYRWELLQYCKGKKTKIISHTHTTHNHFTALWSLSGTTRVSRYQKVHFAIFWIFWNKMKITQADSPTIWMDCHPIQTNWCHPHHFYTGCPSLHNPPNLSWLGTGIKYAGLHTRWLGSIRGGLFWVKIIYNQTVLQKVSKIRWLRVSVMQLSIKLG